VKEPEYITPEEALASKQITKKQYEKIKYGGLTQKQHEQMTSIAIEHNKLFQEVSQKVKRGEPLDVSEVLDENGEPRFTTGIPEGYKRVGDKFVKTEAAPEKAEAVKEPVKLEVAEDDKYVYHNSSQRNIESITKEGLSKEYSEEYPHGVADVSDELKRVYFAESEKATEGFGGQMPSGELSSAMLRVKKSALKGNVKEQQMGLRGKETWYFGDTIPPQDIEIFENGKWRQLAPAKPQPAAKKAEAKPDLAGLTIETEPIPKPAPKEAKVEGKEIYEMTQDEYLKSKGVFERENRDPKRKATVREHMDASEKAYKERKSLPDSTFELYGFYKYGEKTAEDKVKEYRERNAKEKAEYQAAIAKEAKVEVAEKAKLYAGDYVKFKNSGGQEFYGDVKEIQSDTDTIVIQPDGSKNTIEIPSSQIVALEKGGRLRERDEQAKRIAGMEAKRKVEVAEKPEAKEIYEMTESEYVQGKLEDLKGKIKLTGEARNLYLMNWKEKYTITHQRQVEKAIQAGKLPKAKVEIETTPEGKEVTVDLTKKEEAALTPKQQKEYLIAEIDKAIESGLKESEFDNTMEEARKFIKAGINPLTDVKTVYTFEVPNDGTFEIKGSELFDFQKRVESAFPSSIISPKFKPKKSAGAALPVKQFEKILGVAPENLKPAGIDRLFKEVADTEARNITGNIKLNPFQNWLLSQNISKPVKDAIQKVAGKDYIEEAYKEIEATDIEHARSMVEYRMETVAELQDYVDSYKAKTLTLGQINEETGIKRSGRELENALSDANHDYTMALKHLNELEETKKAKPAEKPAGELPKYATKQIPKVLYHATARDFEELDFGERYAQGIFGEKPSKAKAIFFSEKAEDAGYFGRLRGGERILESRISEDVKIADFTGLARSKDIVEAIELVESIDKEWGKMIDEGEGEIQGAFEDPAFIKNLKKAGYDGGRFVEPEGRGTTVAIINKDKIISTTPMEDTFYATKQRISDSEINLSQVRDIFKAPSGLSKDGNIWVKLKSGYGFQVKSVTHISENKLAFETARGRMRADGELIAGKFEDDTIEIVKGIGDKWTVAHEGWHIIRKLGLATPKELRVLKFKIRQLVRQGKFKTQNEKNIGGEEDQAYFMETEVRNRAKYKGTIRTILDKIADFIDSFVNLFTTTSRGITRQFESGAIFQREMGGEVSGINQFAQDVSFSLKKAVVNIRDNPKFVKWFGDSKVVNKKGEPLMVIHWTDTDFTVFDKEMLGFTTEINTDDINSLKMAKAGFWFTDQDISEQTATDIGMPVYLSLQNPKKWKGNFWSLGKNIEKIKKQGYDGIIVKDTEFGGTSYVAFEPTQIKSIFNTEFDPTNPDIRYAMAGKKAIGAPTGALVRAQEMLKEGKSEKEVWKETGWLKGVEKEETWKWEIDDSGAEIKETERTPAYIKINSKEIKTLDDLIDHKVLFKAYPELRKIKIRSDYIEDSKGEYEPETNSIVFPRGFMTKGKELKETLLHEIQHAIQEISGFARGSSPSEMAFKTAFKDTALIESYREAIDNYDKTKEGIAVEQEIYKWLADNKDYTNAQLKVEENRLKEKYPGYATVVSAMEEIQRQNKLPKNATEAYMNLAGEIEARDTSARAKLTAEERRETMPYEAQGIPREDWIVTDGEGTSFSIELKETIEQEARKYKTADEFVDSFGYFRRTNTESPFRDVNYAMFAEDRESISKYGKNLFVPNIIGKFNFVNISSVKDAFREQLLNPENEEILDSYRQSEEIEETAQKLSEELDSEDIVDSAGVFDSPELFDIFWEAIEDKGIDGIYTSDGMIVLNEEAILKESKIIDIWNKAQKEQPKYATKPAIEQDKLVRDLNTQLAKQLGKEWENAYVIEKDVPDATRSVARAFESVFKTKIITVTPTKEKFRRIGGQTYKGNLFIDPNAIKGFVQLAGHELLHKIKSDNSTLYNTFISKARLHFVEFEKFREAFDKTMLPGESSLPRDQIETELLADFTGDALADPDFLKYFARDDAGVFKRFMKTVISWLKGVSDKMSKEGFGSSKYFKDIIELREYLDGVLYAFATRDNVDAIDDVTPPIFSRVKADEYGVDYIKVLNRYEAKLKSAETKLEKIKTEKEILKRRREFIRAARDHFNLTDRELRQISGKDIRFMSNYEFKQYIDGIRLRAEKVEVRRQAMNELMSQIQEKELNIENLRKAMKLPTLKNMTVGQIRKLDEALEPFQKGDEFLSVRKLEVVDRTELKGIKTWREARERLSEKLGVPVKELQSIKVSEFDRFRYETGLAEKNIFYKMMVEETAKRMLVSEAEYLKIEKDIFALAKKLKGVGFFVPQHKNIRKFMEAPANEKAEVGLSEAEMAMAEYMTRHFSDARDYLLQIEAMNMGKENYFTHVRRGILEATKEDGIIKAVKEQFESYKLDEQAFNILDKETGQILAMDKFFKFAMHRTGKLKPTENVVKAFLTYMRTFKKKQALDEITPLIDIYAHALTPKGMTKKGLLLHGNLIKFVKEWINTQKGRHITLIAKQNGKIDAALRAIKMFTSLRDLGLNIPVSVATEVGEQITTYQLLGKRKFVVGKLRQNTKQGKSIIEKYRNLIGKNPWEELAEPAKEVGDRLMEGIFVLFKDASVRSNKTFLLGSLSKEEFKAGEISPEKLAALRTELGRYRMVGGMKSVIGATPEGRAYTQYKRWAIPILRTTIQNLGNLGKKLTFQKPSEAEFKKSMVELYRLVEITAFVMLTFGMVRDEDDESFVGKIINKAYREATTLIQALQPSMFLTAGRTASFVEKLGINLTLILQGEQYKTTDEYKGIKKLKKQFTPVAISQFTGSDEEFWDNKLRKKKAKLNEINDALETSKDKAEFRREYRKELAELRRLNKFQGGLNIYRKRINKLKSMEETEIRSKMIQRLEKQRTEKIKRYLEKE